jgi:hypothetical protein
LIFVQLEVHGVFLEPIDLGNGNSHVLLSPQVPLSQHEVGDVFIGRVDQKLVHPPHTPVGGLYVRPSAYGQFSRRGPLVLDGDKVRFREGIRPHPVFVFSVPKLGEVTLDVFSFDEWVQDHQLFIRATEPNTLGCALQDQLDRYHIFSVWELLLADHDVSDSFAHGVNNDICGLSTNFFDTLNIDIKRDIHIRIPFLVQALLYTQVAELGERFCNVAHGLAQ